MLKKKVLLIGGNFFPEQTGIGRYNGEMIKWLSEHNYDCTVVTSFPYYPHWKVQSPYVKNSFFYKTEKMENVTIYRCPLYVPSKPSGLKRLLLDLSFFASSFFVVLSFLFRKRFDTIIVVAPPFHLGLIAVIYKKIKKCRFVYHIQDLQIEAARELKLITSKFLLGLLFRVERYIMGNADVISSISQGMIKRIASKTNKEVILFPNWSNGQVMFPIKDKQGLKSKFGFKEDDILVLYSGAIGEKQGLESLLSIAQSLSSIPKLKFLICGTGPYKETLKVIASSKRLTNVSFIPLQPSEMFNEFLNMADIHLILQKADAGDLVMPSKLTNILAIGGLVIVTANKETDLYNDIHNNHMGILIEAENQEELQAAITDSIKHTYDTDLLQANALKYANKYLVMDNIMQQFSENALTI